MKKNLLSFLFALIASITLTNAQSTDRPQRSRTPIPTSKEAIDSAVVGRVGMMRTTLNLNDKQALQIIKILRHTYTERAKYAMSDFRSLSEQERKTMRENMQKSELAIQAILDDTQKEKYAQMRESSRPRPNRGQEHKSNDSPRESNSGQ